MATGDPKTIDPRKLQRLAGAARKAGITRLRLADGTEFDLGPIPEAELDVKTRLPIPNEPLDETSPPPGSNEWYRIRFGRRDH
jgi:hypothetical protein